MGPPFIKTYGFESNMGLVLNVGIVSKTLHLQKRPSCAINMSNFFQSFFLGIDGVQFMVTKSLFDEFLIR
jgi:hypothetical protein